MIQGIITITSNLSTSFETLLLLLVVIGGIIFYAKGFQLGIMLHFFTSGILMMALYHYNLNYAPTMVFFFICLVAMCLSMIPAFKSQRTLSGGFI